MPAVKGRVWWQAGMLLLLVLAAYQQVWHAGFMWDDDMHVTENSCIVGPHGFADIWTTAAARIGPLTISSFWALYQMCGLDPLPYHLLNVLLHAVNALLLWRVLLALRVEGAWLGAALWALHPVQVETAAWITELKNTQSALFYLLTVWSFVQWLEQRRQAAPGAWRWYATTLACTVLAMTSKSSTVILPLMLALVWWWMERAWNWRHALWLAPQILCAALTSALSIWTQTLEGGITQAWDRPWGDRIVTAGAVVWFYLGKLAWPHPLTFIYRRWDMHAGEVLSWLPLIALLAAMGWLWHARHTGWRPVFMALTCFVVALIPVLGLVDHYFLRFSFVGDHFQYLASMAPLALAAAGLCVAARRWAAHHSRVLPAFAACLLVTLFALSWRHTRLFENSEALWQDTLVKNPMCWLAHNNLGMESQKRGDLTSAQTHYEASIALYGGDHEVHNNLALVLLNSGRHDEAIQHCRRAVEIRADCFDARMTLGTALWSKGQAEEALAEWRKILEMAPDLAAAHSSLGGALLHLGKVEEALTHCLRAVELRPEDASAWNNLGAAEMRAERLEESLAAYRKAVQVDDGMGSAHYNLAQALRGARRVAEAIPHYEKAVQLMPEVVQPLNQLAWVLATSPDEKIRQPARARSLAEKANALAQGRSALVFRTLAATCAAAGDFPAASEQVQLGLFIAGLNQETDMQQVLQQDQENYRQRLSLTDESLASSPAGVAP